MTNFKPVKKSTPCPVCGHTDACAISIDGAVAICFRTEKGCMTRRDGTKVKANDNMGWFHRIGQSKRTYTPATKTADKHLSVTELRIILKQHQTGISPDRMARAVESIGVSERALRAFGIGFDNGFFSFPMFDGKLKPCGIRLRSTDGTRKISVRGSRNGIFVPDTYESSGISTDDPDCFPLLLLLPEGPTDAAAAFDMGFRAIGRPSNNGGCDILYELLKAGDKQEIVIVADHDPTKYMRDGTPFVPGWEGALHLAESILPECGTLKILRPPGEVKDLRKWMIDGGRQEVLASLISGTELITRTILKEKQANLDAWKKRNKKRPATDDLPTHCAK